MILDLPDDIVKYILSYVNPYFLSNVNKTYYKLFHKTEISTRILRTSFDRYLNNVINRDHYVVFEEMIRENFDKWLKPYKCNFKNMVFNNKIYLILTMCFELDAKKCREIVIEYLAKRNLIQNLHKKKVIRYISTIKQWTS